MSAQPSYVIGSLRYSDNLGDGVIGDCLQYMINVLIPDASVTHLDIAGRTGFSPRSAERVTRWKRAFYALPEITRSSTILITWPFVYRPRILNAWRSSRPATPYIFIVAGGQIVSDIALNFPLKFGLVSKLVARDASPAAIFAAGVSSSFSKLGRALFQRSFDRLRPHYFGVRDARSLANSRMFTLTPSSLRRSIDPAVWASEAYGITRATKGVPRIGIGIAHPRELAVHLPGSRGMEEESAYAFLERVVLRVRERGYEPVLFNNGSAEDALFMRHVSTRLTATHGPVCHESARPLVPRDLVSCISGFDVVVAHRLHANILAYSLQIPSIGIEWDSKVRSFFRETQREDWCLPASVNAAQVSSMIDAALATPMNSQRLTELKDLAMSELRILLERTNA